MAISLSLGSGTLPRVEVILPGADLTAAALWSLTGTAGDFSWTPRGGTGTGAGTQVVVVDALAPVNVAVTYTLRVSGAVVDSDTITRTFTYTGGDGLASDVLADLAGTTVAAVRRLPSDARSPERRFHASTVAGSRFAALRLDPMTGAGGGSLEVASVGADTAAMRVLLEESNALVVYYHDTSRCHLPGCPLSPVEIVYPVSVSSDIGARVDVAERGWSVTYLLQTDPEPDLLLGVSTWDAFDDAGLDWDAFDALGLTWDTFDATDWSEVGA